MIPQINFDFVALFLFPFFVMFYGLGAYTDFTRKKINALGFYFLKGMLYMVIFIMPDKSIIIALLMSAFYFFFSYFHQKLMKKKFFSSGDFTMMMPFSLFCYAFLDTFYFGLVHVFLFFFSLLWFKVVKDRGFAPIVFVVIMSVYAVKYFLFVFIGGL